MKRGDVVDKLSERSKRVLYEIRKYTFEGRTPSVRELCALTGIPSASSVWKELNSLENQGFIKIARGSARGITVCENGSSVAATVPIITSIDPLTNVISYADALEFVPYILPERAVGKAYAMRVTRNTAEFNAGDIAVFYLCDTVPNGRDAAIMFNGTLTVGNVSEEANGSFVTIGGRRYRLGGEADIAVIGRMIGLVRGFL